MAKPVLYYTLVRGWYPGGFEVLAVTTEKRGHDGTVKHLYGSKDGVQSHCKASQTVGKFLTLQAALGTIERVKRTKERHAEGRRIMQAALMLAEKAERDAIEAVVTSMEPGVPPMPYELLRKAAASSPDDRRRKLLGVA